ncbi:MAG: serine/threonine protein kinase [Proteobacteria bacterium]|nr:serine/threonine protein kinase [Pseudomonadota bacterium]
MIRCEHCEELHDEAQSICPVTGKIFQPERLFPPGTVLEGKYRLECALGAGGMGAVFRAVHTMLNKPVAIKLTLPELAQQRELMTRMVREARAASATGHRNIAAVTDMGWTETGGLYLVMEYLDGPTLRELIAREGRLPLPRAAELVCQVLAGLAAVHQRGIVHRDLKPDNVMVVVDEHGGGELAKVLDFGISKVRDDSTGLDLTRSGMIMGSPRYMAPEQAQGAPDVDHRADLYAAGGLLYTALVGEPPIGGATLQALFAQLLQGEIRPPSRLVPGLPAAIDAVVLRAMARDPGDRYASAAAFRDALQPFTQAGLVGGAALARTAVERALPRDGGPSRAAAHPRRARRRLGRRAGRSRRGAGDLRRAASRALPAPRCRGAAARRGSALAPRGARGGPRPWSSPRGPGGAARGGSGAGPWWRTSLGRVDRGDGAAGTRPRGRAGRRHRQAATGARARGAGPGGRFVLPGRLTHRGQGRAPDEPRVGVAPRRHARRAGRDAGPRLVAVGR